MIFESPLAGEMRLMVRVPPTFGTGEMFSLDVPDKVGPAFLTDR